MRKDVDGRAVTRRLSALLPVWTKNISVSHRDWSAGVGSVAELSYGRRNGKYRRKRQGSQCFLRSDQLDLDLFRPTDPREI